MRVLVTGGAGFIGSHLVDRLVALGHEVIVLDNFSTGRTGNLPHVIDTENLRVTRGDIRHFSKSILKRVRKVDRVCHLAARTSVQESIRNPIATSDVNLVGTLRVLEAARKLGAERVVYASSAAVYGIPETLPIIEGARVAPISPYGASKAASELYCTAFEENHGIEAVSLRIFNVYGPRQTSSHYAGVISIFARKILRRLPPIVFGNGSQTRDFVFVTDVVDGTIAALEKTIRSRVFNIASGKETTILQLAKKMQEIAGSPQGLKFNPPRRGDISRSVADITRAQTELGFTPRTSLSDGLSTTIEWFASGR